VRRGAPARPRAAQAENEALHALPYPTLLSWAAQAENEALHALVLEVAANKAEAQQRAAGLREKYARLLGRVRRRCPALPRSRPPLRAAPLAAAARRLWPAWGAAACCCGRRRRRRRR
jgi:hypothetical protein